MTEPQPSTFDFRYEVGTEDWREHFAKFEDAKHCALVNGGDVLIYDRCARRGRPNMWGVRDGRLCVKSTRDKVWLNPAKNVRSIGK